MKKSAYRRIALQAQDFDPDAELRRAESAVGHCGALVSFTGKVRLDDGVDQMFLEHYEGMTEAVLEELATVAIERWSLQGIILLHRVGELMLGDNIVLVVTMTEHRQAAFDANMFLMDYLKTKVPLWKKEIGRDAKGKSIERWVESTQTDREAMTLWSA